MIERLDANRLREATGDDPMVRAAVLGGRIAGVAWAGFGRTHGPARTGKSRASPASANLAARASIGSPGRRLPTVTARRVSAGSRPRC